MKIRSVFAAILCLLWSGFFFLPEACAYGPGTQMERYPQMLPASQFPVLAAEKLEATLKEQGENRRHELKFIRGPQTMHCPPGEITCEATLPRQIHYGATTPVYVSVYIDGKFYRRVNCYYRVVVYDRVLVAARDLPLEHEIAASDVRMEEREIESKADVYLANSSEVMGRVPAHVIREGTPITARMLQSPFVMEPGTKITLVANHNGIQVRVEGVAMQRGRIGKIIRVRNAASRKVLRGEVVDATTVEIL